MLLAILEYGLCLASGIAVERRIPLTGAFKRVSLILACSTAQIMLAVQVLSLVRAIASGWFLVFNLAVSTAVIFAVRRLPKSPYQLPWGEVLSRVRAGLSRLKRDPALLAFTGLASAYLVSACLIGWAMVPFGDPYHQEMPLFWIQNRSALPFAVQDPRIVSLSFLTEAVSLPGYLYAHSPSMAPLLTFIGAGLCVWAVFCLARRVGGSLSASLCSALLVLGCSVFGLVPVEAQAAGFFSAAWVGASVICLLDSRMECGSRVLRDNNLLLSVFFFVMACGAKNTTALLAPIYAAALLWALSCLPATPVLGTAGPRRGLRVLFLAPRRCLQGLSLRMVSSFAVVAVAGLLFSGMAWNYINNLVWFGNSSGPTFLRQTVSRDYHPRSVWTRVCRGAVEIAYDTLWIPKSAAARYADLSQTTVMALGGEGKLPEDEGFYTFTPQGITPKKGLGLLGVFFVLPALPVALARVLRTRASSVVCVPHMRHNVLWLLAFSVGFFVLGHSILRWQSIGLLRLLLPLVVLAAPLTALLLEKTWAKHLAFALFTLSAMDFSIHSLTLLQHRRMGDGQAFNWIPFRQQSAPKMVTCAFEGLPKQDLPLWYDYSSYEISRAFLSHIKQPCRIGAIGDYNTDFNVLFGADYKNLVFPMCDSRAPERIFSPPSDMDYFVAFGMFDRAVSWAGAHGFHQIAQITEQGKSVMLGFERSRIPPGGATSKMFAPTVQKGAGY